MLTSVDRDLLAAHSTCGYDGFLSSGLLLRLPKAHQSILAYVSRSLFERVKREEGVCCRAREGRTNRRWRQSSKALWLFLSIPSRLRLHLSSTSIPELLDCQSSLDKITCTRSAFLYSKLLPQDARASSPCRNSFFASRSSALHPCWNSRHAANTNFGETSDLQAFTTAIQWQQSWSPARTGWAAEGYAGADAR